MSHTVRLDTSDQESESLNEELQEEQIEEPMYYILNELLVTEKGENVATMLGKIATELAAIRVSLEKFGAGTGATASSSVQKTSSSQTEEEH